MKKMKIVMEVRVGYGFVNERERDSIGKLLFTLVLNLCYKQVYIHNDLENKSLVTT